MANIQPLGDRVVLKTVEAEEKTASGIILPESAKEKPEQGKVIAVGTGRYEDGKKIPVEVEIGDTVLYTKFGPTEVKVEGEELLIVKEEDILAIVK